MERGYKISLLLAFMVSLLLVSLNRGADIFQSPLGALLMVSAFFLVLGFGFSGAYYCFRRKNSPYASLLIAAVLLTAFLFFMDYSVWDKNPPNPSVKQIITESLFIGPIYVSLFFGLFSGVYFISESVGKLLKRMGKA